MKTIYTEQANKDLRYWQKTDPKKVTRIENLIKAIQSNPLTGIGKPELLRFEYQGYWSRRIDQEHRLIYKIHQDTLYIVQCRYHYI